MFRERRIRRSLIILVTGWVAAISTSSVHLQSSGLQPLSSASAQALSSSAWRAMLDQYCVGCHNQKLRTAGLTLDTITLAKVGEQADVWEKVIRKLRMGAMPPVGRPRPDQATKDAFVTWLEKEID